MIGSIQDIVFTFDQFWPKKYSVRISQFVLLPGMKKPLSLQVLDKKTLNTSNDTLNQILLELACQETSETQYVT